MKAGEAGGAERAAGLGECCGGLALALHRLALFRGVTDFLEPPECKTKGWGQVLPCELGGGGDGLQGHLPHLALVMKGVMFNRRTGLSQVRVARMGKQVLNGFYSHTPGPRAPHGPE